MANRQDQRTTSKSRKIGSAVAVVAAHDDVDYEVSALEPRPASAWAQRSWRLAPPRHERGQWRHGGR